MKPNQAKLKTLPYLLKGLRIGIERAFPLTGLMSGACHRVATLKPMIGGLLIATEKCRNDRGIGLSGRVIQNYEEDGGDRSVLLVETMGRTQSGLIELPD